MTHKSEKVRAMVARFEGQPLDARYLGFFECFNQSLYYEAHDVLEDLWLEDRKGADGNFYKGLIQLAGAFVHLQKHRLKPAGALFNLASANLRTYPGTRHGLNIEETLRMIAAWTRALEAANFKENPLTEKNRPRLAPSQERGHG